MTPGESNILNAARQQNRNPSASEWEIRPLGELIRHIIERHHVWLRAELPETGRLIRRAIEGGGRERSSALTEMEQLFRRFHREIEDHLKKEEVLLFPLIERLEQASAMGTPAERHMFGSIQNPVQFMMQDHELAHRLLSKMKEMVLQLDEGEPLSAARQAILERLNAVEADLVVHSRLEDEILFPRAIRLESDGTTLAL